MALGATNLVMFSFLLQFLSCLVQLPPLLSTTDILWLSCFCYPLLSISLLGKPPHSSIMSMATGKNLQSIPKKTQHYFLLCFLLKFSLTISSCLVCFGFTLQSFCDSARARNLTNCSSVMLCRWVLGVLSSPPHPTPPCGPSGGRAFAFLWQQ